MLMDQKNRLKTSLMFEYMGNSLKMNKDFILKQTNTIEPSGEKTDCLSSRPNQCTVTEARSLKFRILEEKGLYYLCSENEDYRALFS